MQKTTRAVVEALLARLGVRDLDGVAALYADHVDWQLDWPPDAHDADVPWIRRRSTRADVAEHFATIAAEHLPQRAGFDLGRILVDGHDAVITGTIHNTLRRNGNAYSARVALHLGIEGGRIVRHHVYEDSLAIARAWDGAAGSAQPITDIASPECRA